MLFQTLPQIVGIGLRDPTSLAVLFWGNGWEFSCASGEDVAIALVQILAFSRGEFLPLALGDPQAGLLQQAFHVLCPAVSVGVYDERQLPQQVRAAQAMAAMVVGQVRGPAIVDHHPTVARDHADGFDRLAAALGVQELQGDLAGGANMNPVILLVDPKRGLIDVHRGLGQELLDGRALPHRQGMMQSHHIVEDRRLRDGHVDQGLERVLDSFERQHLSDQQVQNIGFDPGPVLQ